MLSEESIKNYEEVKKIIQQYSGRELIEAAENLCFMKKAVKKIVKIGVYYPRLYNGGTERVISLLMDIWAEMGYEVVLFTEEEPSEKDYPYSERVERVILNNAVDVPAEEYLDRAEELKNKVIETEISCMVYNAWLSDKMLYDMLVVKALDVPFIVYTHGIFSAVYRYFSPEAEYLHRVWKLSDCVLSLTESGTFFYQCVGAKSFYVQNPVGESLQWVRHSDLKSKKILWIGRLSREKGIEDVIDIFAKVKLKVPEAILQIVGEGEAEIYCEIKKKCSLGGLEDSVEFCGYQSDVDKYYGNAALLLMTSFIEGMPMTLLESKAYGLPCVMYDLSYLALGKRGQGNMLVKQKDKTAAAEAVIEILLNDKKRMTLGRESLKAFSELMVYDIRGQWKSIFEWLESAEQDAVVCGAGNEMISLLIEHTKANREEEIEHVMAGRTYQVGMKVLAIPRKIKHMLSGLYKR